MRKHRLAVCLIIGMVLFLLAFPHPTQGQDYYVYNVQIRSDGSALWMITQFSSANTPVETWENFQQKIFTLVDSATSVTHRTMDVDENSLQINSTLSSESKTTEYSFIWRNFSLAQGGELSFGDVFQVNGFFNQLFGDAALKLSYPEDFVIKSVDPPPYQRQDSLHAMEWARTQDLAVNTALIVLASTTQTYDGSSLSQNGLIIGGILTAGISVSLIGFYALKKRKGNGMPTQTTIVQPAAIATDEDKILALLRTSGGTMRQSEVTERCGFSKAKTSQLLTALEKAGNLTRYKKGRDKIVTLKEQVNGE